MWSVEIAGGNADFDDIYRLCVVHQNSERVYRTMATALQPSLTRPLIRYRTLACSMDLIVRQPPGGKKWHLVNDPPFSIYFLFRIVSNRFKSLLIGFWTSYLSTCQKQYNIYPYRRAPHAS